MELLRISPVCFPFLQQHTVITFINLPARYLPAGTTGRRKQTVARAGLGWAGRPPSSCSSAQRWSGTTGTAAADSPRSKQAALTSGCPSWPTANAVYRGPQPPAHPLKRPNRSNSHPSLQLNPIKHPTEPGPAVTPLEQAHATQQAGLTLCGACDAVCVLAVVAACVMS